MGVIWIGLGHAEDSGANANLLEREFSESEVLKPGMQFHCASCGWFRDSKTCELLIDLNSQSL